MRKAQLAGVLVALGALLVLPHSAFAAGFANTAQSGTSTGMAGVATANADEPNTNFFNPSSMGFAEEGQVYLGPTFILPSVSYTSPNGDITEETKSGVFYPPNFSFAMPVVAGVSAGVGITFPWGLGIAWPDDWVGRETFRSQSLETININPNVAYKLPFIDLSVAAGAQLMRSALRQERVIILREDREVDIVLGGVGYGLGVTFATMYKPTDEITLGLNYRSGSTLNYSGRAHFSDDVEGTPFEQRFVDQEIATSISLPHTINVGVGWQLNRSLWLGVDVNYMTWSVYDEVEVEFSEQSPEGEPGEADPPLVVAADWHDAVAFRLGAQYDIIAGLRARAGFAFDMTPVPDETVGPSLPDNHRFVFSTGVGYNIDNFRTDLGYQLIYLNEREITNGNVDGTYQLGSHLVGLNVGYSF